MLINCLKFGLNAASQKQTNKLFGDFIPLLVEVIEVGLGKAVSCIRVCLVNVFGIDFCL